MHEPFNTLFDHIGEETAEFELQAAGALAALSSRQLVNATRAGAMTSTVLCHGLAQLSGWWSDRATGDPLTLEQVNVPEKLCLVHSEISEAMEGYRKDRQDDHLPHRSALEAELADALIRIYDLAGFLKLDLSGAMIEKLAYNQQRADHKLSNRQAVGGKKF